MLSGVSVLSSILPLMTGMMAVMTVMATTTTTSTPAGHGTLASTDLDEFSTASIALNDYSVAAVAAGSVIIDPVIHRPTSKERRAALQRRRLSTTHPAQCPFNQTMRKDGVWYDIEVDLYSPNELPCDDAEWADLRTFMETALDDLDLFESFFIYDINARLCQEQAVNDRRQRRRMVVNRNPDDPDGTHQPDWVPETLYEDDERFWRYLEGAEYEEHRRLSSEFFYIWYDLFFRGGDKVRDTLRSLLLGFDGTDMDGEEKRGSCTV